MKKFEVTVSEVKEKTLYVVAESVKDAEDRAVKMYSTGGFVMDKPFDSYVEAAAREPCPISKEYLQELGWNSNFTEYILELFDAMDIRNSVLFSDLIGFCNEKAFNRDFAEVCGFEFKYLVPGVFDEVSGCYKTKDNKYIAKINL